MRRRSDIPTTRSLADMLGVGVRWWHDAAAKRLRWVGPDGASHTLLDDRDGGGGGGGTGDVVGPASATAGAPAVFDGTTGKLIKQLVGEGVLGLVSGVLTKITTTLGDLVYGGASGTPTRLAGNTTTTLKVLTQTGDGANSAAPAWTAVSGLTGGTASNPGVLKLGAAGGAAAYRSPSHTVTGDETLTEWYETLYVTSAAKITLAAVSAGTIGLPMRVVVRTTAKVTVELITNAADKIEGAARVGCYGDNIDVEVIPVAATKVAVRRYAGIVAWQVAVYDFTAASSTSPWNITNSISGNADAWSDVSSASSSVAASSGLACSPASGASYYGSSAATGGIAAATLSAIEDGNGRALRSDDAYWFVGKSSVTSGSTTSTSAHLAVMPATLTGNKLGVVNDSASGTVLHRAYDSATRSLTLTGTATVSAAWTGFHLDGAAQKHRGGFVTTTPTGTPGTDWWPWTYDSGDGYAPGPPDWGAPWAWSSLTRITVGATASAASRTVTWTSLVILRVLGAGET